MASALTSILEVHVVLKVPSVEEALEEVPVSSSDATELRHKLAVLLEVGEGDDLGELVIDVGEGAESIMNWLTYLLMSDNKFNRAQENGIRYQ